MKKIISTMAVFAFMNTSAFSGLLSDETKATSEKLGAKYSAQVDFEKGKANLSNADIEEINQFIETAKKAGKIEEVRVLSWADREYPAKGTKASKTSVKLADARGKAIKEYLKKGLALDDVETYNMAQRPNAIEKFFKTSDARVKRQMETTKNPDVNLDFKDKASQALLLVYYENN